MKKLIALIFFVICFSGCSDTGPVNDSEDGSGVIDGGIAVSAFGNEYTGFEDMYYTHLHGETLYYIQSIRQEGNQIDSKKVFRWPKDGQSEEVASFPYPQQNLICYTVDENGSIYYLYSDMTGDYRDYRFSLRKNAPDGSLVYCVEAGTLEEMGILGPEAGEEEQIEEIRKWVSINNGTASVQGQVCFYSSSTKVMFMFDSNGSFLCDISSEQEVAGYNTGLVNAGEVGIFLYRIEDSDLLYQKLDWENRSIGKASRVALEEGSDSQYPVSGSSSNSSYAYGPFRFSVLDGYAGGFLISSIDTLWDYDPVEETLVRLLGWSEPYVNLSGDYVEHVTLLEDNMLFVIALDPSDNSYKQIMVETKPGDEVPERQTITLGIVRVSNPDSLQKTINEFNKLNPELQVEIQVFKNQDELNMVLLKKEGPDLLEMNRASRDVLANKGVLEDMSPYLSDSTAVRKEDLLPSVLRTCYYQGELLFIIPDFAIHVLAAAEEGVGRNYGWSPEDVLDFAERNPDIPVLDSTSYNRWFLLADLLRADMDSYIEWEERKCYFDSDRFISLLERVNKLKVDEFAPTRHDVDGIALTRERFLNKEYLLMNTPLSRMEDYVYMKEALEGNGSIIGYPVQDRSPHFLMNCEYIFGMNSASKNKESAWLFLEYLLSKEYQSRYIEERPSGFPVRKDIFEEMLLYSLLDRYPPDIHTHVSDFNTFTFTETDYFPEVTGEDKEAIRYIVDNSYLDLVGYGGNGGTVNYMDIIAEEVSAFFAGDKTAKEAADIIQSRIMIYINE